MVPETRTWSVSVRSEKIQYRVEAARVAEENGQLVFYDAQGDQTGAVKLADLQGVSVEPSPRVRRSVTIVSPSQEGPAPAEAEGSHMQSWRVALRGKKDHHDLDAADVKETDGRLVFTDLRGDLTGWFDSAEVKFWLPAPPEAGGITVIIGGAPGEPGAIAD